jgi:glutamyl-tRNA reductase
MHPSDAIVQSCQRLEAYGFGDCDCDAPVRLGGRAALERLAEVAAGLDSVVLGESEIMGQVRQAFRETRGSLRAAADVALAAAREARRCFPVRSHAGHLLDRALSLAGLAPEGTLLVLGTGAMGRLVAQRGRELGFHVTVSGRRDPALGIPFLPLADLDRLPAGDVIVGCLGSGAGLIDPTRLPPARLIIDLGTPRNFSDAAVPMLRLGDLLAAEAGRPHATALRSRLRHEVARVLEQRVARLSEDSGHPIGRFRRAAEDLREQALLRALATVPDADPGAVDRALRSALNRLLHDLTTRLRASADFELAASLADRLEAATRATYSAPAESVPARVRVAG